MTGWCVVSAGSGAAGQQRGGPEVARELANTLLQIEKNVSNKVAQPKWQTQRPQWIHKCKAAGIVH
jgi:hypothetical protein